MICFQVFVEKLLYSSGLLAASLEFFLEKI